MGRKTKVITVALSCLLLMGEDRPKNQPTDALVCLTEKEIKCNEDELLLVVLSVMVLISVIVVISCCLIEGEDLTSLCIETPLWLYTVEDPLGADPLSYLDS
mmetsp:Transcript_21367/g.45037  ORF Transcript_21367/g.45037 Transcript_21367/m.45037 type:complete len:102 (+) Transcript_21367:705-1010(+)